MKAFTLWLLRWRLDILDIRVYLAEAKARRLNKRYWKLHDRHAKLIEPHKDMT